MLKDYPTRINSYRRERDIFEEKIRNKIINSRDLSCNSRKEITRNVFEESKMKTDKWISKVRSCKTSFRNRWYYSSEWASINKKARISDHLV